MSISFNFEGQNWKARLPGEKHVCFDETNQKFFENILCFISRLYTNWWFSTSDIYAVIWVTLLIKATVFTDTSLCVWLHVSARVCVSAV